jgi:3-oxoacyl-[acyl-carrier protein] reductase
MTSNPRARVAIVTGGSGGIGQIATKRLAADGLSVVIHYAGSPAPAKDALTAITAAGGTASLFQADVAHETEVAALFDYAEQTYGGIDVVVHTAGIMLLAPLAELDLADLDWMHRVNIRGTFIVDQQAARRIRSGGALINFSSSMVKIALPHYTAYAAAKGAVDAITLILAKELRGRDITVNAVAPGPTATPLFLDGKRQETINELASLPPPAAPRNTRGHRRGGVLPRRPGSLGERPGSLRQRGGDLMAKNILVNGASSGFDALTVRALANVRHIVYASIRDTDGRNMQAVTDAAGYAADRGVDLRPVATDVSDQGSVDAAIAKILAKAGRLDVVVHNAGHMLLGPTKASPPNRSPRSTTSTFCPRNGSTALPRTCMPTTDFSSGSDRAARAELRPFHTTASRRRARRPPSS